MRVCLFEDHGAIDLEPLALTRPVFDLLCGAGPLAAKQTQYFSPCTAGTLVRPFLADVWCDRVVERLVRAGLLATTPSLVRTGRDRLAEVDRWIGGVHLQGAPRWRWDPRLETLVAGG